MTIEKKLNGTDPHPDRPVEHQHRSPAECELKASLNSVESLVLDFAGLDYLFSAGLRVLLAAQKRMNKQDSMVVRNVNETIAESFDATGFCDILTIE